MLLTLILSVLVFSSVSTRQFPSPYCTHKYRLSGNVKPSFYSIKIHPDLTNEVFTGEVLIHIKIDQTVEFVELHSSLLHIDSIHFDSKKVIPKTCCLPHDHFGYEFSEFELIRIVRGNKQLIAPGAHILHIKYHGQFSKTTEGIFKAGCTKNGNTHSYLLATDFEPTLARQAFPCFDEPGFKAQFQLSLVVPDDSYKALSNMRALEKFDISDGVVYKFEPTPPMPTYLLSFVITQHSYNEYVDDSGLPLRIYSFNATSENNTSFLEFSSKAIKFYSNYTRYNYTLPKIDFIGFDRSESAATENWGLVTFNTSLLSADDDGYDEGQKIMVIAHELAHFWFGNLVTNEWWDDIWLHEAVATFISAKAEDFILQNDASKHFPMMYDTNLLWEESNTNSTPVVNFQEIPARIRENFNDIVYNKGATILRMLELVMGEEQLRNGIVEYIQKHAFKTATTSDFLDVVTKFSNEVNLREFIETYLYQSKYPVITVEEEEDRYVLKQQSCVQVPNNEESPYGYKWTLPISYITDSNKDFVTIWFYKDAESLTIPKYNTTWIKLNYRQIGYYLVHYSTNLWEKLIEHNQEIEPHERNNLLVEAASSFEMNRIPCDIVLRYLWEVSNSTQGSSLERQYAFVTYIKLTEIVKHDEEALYKLKNFFGHVLLRAQMKELAQRFLSNASSSSYYEENKLQVSKVGYQVEPCIEWLKTKTDEYIEQANYSVADKV